MSGARFEVEKFDGANDLELCRIEIKAFPVEHGLDEALEGEGGFDGLGCKYRIQDGVMKVSEGALVLMIGVLLEGLYALQSKTGSTSAMEWTPEEKYFDVLGHGGVNQCRECRMVSKSKSLVRRYVAFDKAALTKHCKSASRVKVEPCVKATSWKKVEFKDSKTLEPQTVVIKDVQTGRKPPLKKYGLRELVVLENAEAVANSACLMVSESSAKISTKLDTSEKSMGGLDLSNTCKSEGGACKMEIC
ncbi:hypothetical protein CRG98_013246 [Punica granatum]|uniref:Uncharacterized protein n=1 Tax=Punica granatum TaxID=22663 RepID=A0A2I0KD37_PUNGR|nr:hypothetical protein CRG98_013246 [Punica granatum]